MTASIASPGSESAVGAAFDGELALLQPDTRRSPERLLAFLAPEFREIGASGRMFDRDTIIAALTSEAVPPAAPEPQLSELTGDCVGADLVLLTYRLSYEGRTSRRSSLWRVRGGRAELLFHQGTPVA